MFKVFQIEESFWISSANLFGHEILNILPVYDNETLNSPKQPCTPEQLEELQKQLTKKVEVIEPVKETKEINEKNRWLPIRKP